MPRGGGRSHATELAVLAGLISGALVLGIGGRILMRVLAFTTPEAPRFTWEGSVQVVVIGACWGAATAPLLVLVDRWRAALGRATSAVFALGVLALAVCSLVLLVGLNEVVAPKSFIVLSVALFPALFLVHGLAVEALWRRWTATGQLASPGPSHYSR